MVDNVATILAIYDAMNYVPFTHKYLTVNGDVCHPTVLRVPIGTSISYCLDLAGGTIYDDYFVVAGGPMMGRPLTKEQAKEEVVTKTTSGILVLPKNCHIEMRNAVNVRHMLNRARAACIQCSACSQLCPRHLLGHPLEPHRIMRKISLGQDLKTMTNDPIIQSALLCCECGICEEYACPMELQPRRINAMLKKMLAAEGIRYHGIETEFSVLPERDIRKVPSKRLAARIDILRYYHTKIGDFTEKQPDKVSIPVKMHIGAPSVPVVEVGEWVESGQLIATCPDEVLGSHIHASVSGRITGVGQMITIDGMAQ